MPYTYMDTHTLSSIQIFSGFARSGTPAEFSVYLYTKAKLYFTLYPLRPVIYERLLIYPERVSVFVHR